MDQDQAAIDPEAFARAWADAWNRRDVEAVLDHFHEDVLFTSPFAAEMLPETAGVVRGKPALRHYWTEALKHTHDLHFTVEDVYLGIAILVITYRNQRKVRVNEVLRFEGAKIRKGHGTYPVASPKRTL